MKTAAPILLLCLSALASPAADWPRWRGPSNDGRLPAGDALPASLAPEAKVLWRKAIGDGMASPVVAGGLVFCLDNRNGRETAFALSAEDGRERWSADLDEVFSDHLESKGPRCAPVADGDRVYVQSCRGEFKCLDVATGRVRWRTNFVTNFGAVFLGETGNAKGAGRHGYTGSALIDGDRLFAGVGGADGAGMVCFDKNDGKVLWKSLDDTPAYAGPALASPGGVRQLLCFMADAVAALDPETGRPLWRVPVKTSYGRHVMTPVTHGDTVVVSSHQAGLIGIRVKQDGGALLAEPAWTNRPAAVNFASPVAVGGFLYGLGPAQKLQCVDIASGNVKWAQRDFNGAPLKKDWLGLLAAGDRLLGLADNGRLVLFAADPSGFKPLGALSVCGPTWCNPALAEGRLYLRDGKELSCVAVGPFD